MSPQLVAAHNRSIVFFEELRSGDCASYLIGCRQTRAAVIIDPNRDRIDQYQALIQERGLCLRYLIDTHTHADHFSATQELSKRMRVPVVMHHNSICPFVDLRVDEGEMVVVGKHRLRVLHTPGHTDDSICLILDDRVFTGDTLLYDGTGRTDLPTGSPEALYESLFGKLLKLDDSLLVFPAHNYKGVSPTTLATERNGNPRLRAVDRDDFVRLVQGQDRAMPAHLTEALRTNRSGGKTLNDLISDAIREIPFLSMEVLKQRIDQNLPGLLVLDVREESSFVAGHIRGSLNIPRGQLELRVDTELPDPTAAIVVVCQYGKVSTLAAQTLKRMGYGHVVALDAGLEAWEAAGYPLES